MDRVLEQKMEDSQARESSSGSYQQEDALNSFLLSQRVPSHTHVFEKRRRFESSRAPIHFALLGSRFVQGDPLKGKVRALSIPTHWY